MRRALRLAAILTVLGLLNSSANATVIQVGWFFDNNDDSDVSAISQTVVAAGGEIQFDVDVTISSVAGTVVDTSNTGPATDGGPDGIGVGAGNNISAGQTVTFGVSVSNIIQLGGPHTLNLEDLTFRFIGTEVANGNGSSGTLTVPAGSASWTDANGNPGIPGPPQFYGHVPGTITLGGALGAGQEGFFTDMSGQTSGSTFDVDRGFDLLNTNSGLGGAFGAPVTSFSHTTTAGDYRLNDLVIQLRATPEPSSFALMGVVLMMGLVGFAWKRRSKVASIAS